MNMAEDQRHSYTTYSCDLLKLDLQVDKDKDFTAWHLQWKSYSSLSGLDKEETLRQVEAFIVYVFERNIG